MLVREITLDEFCDTLSTLSNVTTFDPGGCNIVHNGQDAGGHGTVIIQLDGRAIMICEGSAAY